MYAELSGRAADAHDYREGGANQSSPSDGRPAGRVVTGRELNTHFKRDDVDALHTMLLVGRAMEQNWPDYALWSTVKFQIRPLTTMALNFCFWVEGQLDLYNDLADHLDVEGMEMTFNSDDEAFEILDMIGMYLQDIPIMVYGYEYPHRYTGQKDHWLSSVIDHITGEYPHTYDPTVAQFPRCCYKKDLGKLVNVLAASTNHRHRQLATVLAYINKGIGIDVVDWSLRGLQDSGLQNRPHEWQMPNYIDRVRGNQLFGALIESLYLNLSQELAFNPDATLDFILPMYGAMAVIQGKVIDADSRSKALIDVLFDSDDGTDAGSLYEIIFPEDPADANDYFRRANEWLGNTEPFEKPIISISLE